VKGRKKQEKEIQLKGGRKVAEEINYTNRLNTL
jgi:hypothetical protein